MSNMSGKRNWSFTSEEVRRIFAPGTCDDVWLAFCAQEVGPLKSVSYLEQTNEIEGDSTRDLQIATQPTVIVRPSTTVDLIEVVEEAPECEEIIASDLVAA